jgi:hypothetical protein
VLHKPVFEEFGTAYAPFGRFGPEKSKRLGFASLNCPQASFSIAPLGLRLGGLTPASPEATSRAPNLANTD